MRILFPEGALDCPFNESNLPVVRITMTSDAARDLKALHACVMSENNQNLMPAQKELLKWHAKLGHIDFQLVQRLLKSGAFGNNPLI